MKRVSNGKGQEHVDGEQTRMSFEHGKRWHICIIPTTNLSIRPKIALHECTHWELENQLPPPPPQRTTHTHTQMNAYHSYKN